MNALTESILRNTAWGLSTSICMLASLWIFQHLIGVLPNVWLAIIVMTLFAMSGRCGCAFVMLQDEIIIAKRLKKLGVKAIDWGDLDGI